MKQYSNTNYVNFSPFIWKQVQKYRIDAYSWQTLNWIEAPELQIIGIYKTLQYKIDSNLRHLQDFVGAP